jgi:hypothetical protein
MPAAVPGTKETERIRAVQREIGREAVQEKGREIEPDRERIGVKEISLDQRVELDEDLKQMGVEALVPPAVPEELQPQAEVVALGGTSTESEAGRSQPLTSSFRWLSTLWGRLVKKVGGGFRYVFRNLGTQETRE